MLQCSPDSGRQVRHSFQNLQHTLTYLTERARLDAIKDAKKELEEAKYRLEVAQRQGQFELASRLRFSTIPELEKKLPKESEGNEPESPLAMLHDRVTSNDIARVVARSTGIPVQNLLKGERDRLVHVSGSLTPASYDSLNTGCRWKMLYGDVWSARITS